MPDLNDSDREKLAGLRERFGDVSIESDTGIDGTLGHVDPMLAGTLESPLESLDPDPWIAEPKYDGTRLIVQTLDGEIRAYTRRGIDRYDDIEPVHADLAAQPDGLILDGELTYLTPSGISSFHPIHTAAGKLADLDLSVVYFVFDILYDGEDCTGESLLERNGRLEASVVEGETVQLTPGRTEAFPSFYRELTEAGEEGIMLKRRESRYFPGVRSDQWLKVKRFTERDAIVIGYTEGTGNRRDFFGALVLTDGDRYIGRVGSGFSRADLTAIRDRFTPTDDRPIPEDRVGVAYTPVEPFVISVKYQETTNSGKLRAPVFLGVNSEKPMADVQPLE